MTKAQDRLRAIGIINTYDVQVAARKAGLLPVSIVFYADTSRERGGRSARWQVRHLTEQTDPGNHWQDYGHKTFSVFMYGRNGTSAEQRAAARQAAIEWTNEKYGTDQWGTVPGIRIDLFPLDVVALVKGALKSGEPLIARAP
jgi:hypothetical protein